MAQWVGSICRSVGPISYNLLLLTLARSWLKLFKQQLEAQNERIELQQRQMEKQMEVRQEQMEQLIARLGPPPKEIAGTQPAVSIPNFMPFDSISELWKDYLARFYTFAAANSIPEDKMAQVFLTNQTTANYKLLATLAGQQMPPRRNNDLEMKDITTFMEPQYDPKQFVVRERFKFRSGSPRKPGEKVTKPAASTCDFPAIKDTQDEAMRTHFICAVKNEAVLKAVFKLQDDELTFSKAVDVAQEMEEAAKVAKKTVHGSSETPSTESMYACLCVYMYIVYIGIIHPYKQMFYLMHISVIFTCDFSSSLQFC